VSQVFATVPTIFRSIAVSPRSPAVCTRSLAKSSILAAFVTSSVIVTAEAHV